MTNTMTFNRETITEALSSLSGNTFVGLTTETNVKLKGGKSNPMQDRVTKVTESVVQIFTNQNGSAYGAMVNRRLAEEGKDTYELKPRQWGERVEGTPFVTHKGKDYLEVIFKNVSSVEYFLDGEPIEKDDIEGLNERPSNGDQGGLENKVILRTYSLDSIRDIRAFNKEFSNSAFDLG